MENRTKRIAVIEDLSCIGRCSLGVAMSVLPVMGVETAMLPTAILSCHTAFDSFTFVDFTPEAEKIMNQWHKMQLRFDAIYIGYLGSEKLVELALRFIDLFRTPEVQLIVDPAFGDHGRLYTGFDLNYVRAIRRLCARADIILPNVTEACFLLDAPYAENPDHSANIAAQAQALLGENLKNVLITSCHFPGDRTGLICMGKNAFTHIHERRLPPCHGSGDLFASVFAGLMLRCGEVEKSARAAADFTFDCLRYSSECPDHRWYGVDYEAMLPELVSRLKSF